MLHQDSAQGGKNATLGSIMFVQDGIVDMRRVDTDGNTADVFTKTLGTDVITRLRPGLTGYGPLPPIPCATPI